jgi:hypothetical protein
MKIRAEAERVVPIGEHRAVVGSIEDGSVICGYTRLNDRSRQSFTEPLPQVVADVSRGFSYTVAVAGIEKQITVDAKQTLTVDGIALGDVLPNLSGQTDPPWEAWWEIASHDATYYRGQRKP